MSDVDLESLARAVDRVARRVDDLAPTVERVGVLDERTDRLGEMFAMLADRVRGIDEARPAQSWLLLSDPDKAGALLEDLVQWLDAVYLRYPGVSLPACWYRHPWVVEELWWLRTSHCDAYSARVWGVAAGMWHDQQRPRAVERIQKGIGSCDMTRHLRGGAAARPPVAAPLAGHVQGVAEAWTTHGLMPEPTAAELADAQAYDDEQLHLPDH